MKLSMLLWLTSLMPQPVADQACLATTVYLEARSEPTIGQLAVAEVALRRRDQGRYGKTVCAVVTAPHQFATTTTPGSFDVDNLDSFHKAWLVASKSILNWQLPVAQRPPQRVPDDVDHDHSCCPGSKTCGKCLRGLACQKCNQGIGQFGDDPDRMRRVADNLEAANCRLR